MRIESTQINQFNQSIFFVISEMSSEVMLGFIGMENVYNHLGPTGHICPHKESSWMNVVILDVAVSQATADVRTVVFDGFTLVH